MTVRELTPVRHGAGACGSLAYAAKVSAATRYSDQGYPITSDDLPNDTVDATAAKNASGNVVGILVCFDKGAQDWVTGTKKSDINTFAQTAVDKMNGALLNNDLLKTFHFELKGVLAIDVDASKSSTDVLDDVISYVDGSKTGKFAGYDWSNVRRERAKVGADIASVLCYSGADSGTVGIGDSLSTDGGDCGYNACLVNAVDQDHTMTHECGHNMGAGHENLLQGDNGGPQYYSYSSGYYFTANVKKSDDTTVATACHTIMAYDSDVNGNEHPCEAPCFSSPRQTFFGVAAGTTDKNDNAKTLELNYKEVAQNHVNASSDSANGQTASKVSARWKTSEEHPWSFVEEGGATDEEDEDDDDCIALSAVAGEESWCAVVVSNRVSDVDDLAFFVEMPSNGTLQVLADSTELTNIVADTDEDWDEVVMPLPTGSFTLTFKYSPGDDGSEDDFCLLDEIDFNEDVTFPESVTETNSVVKTAVPYDWIDEHYPEDWDNYISPDARVRKMGANGRPVWESYVLDLDPTNETSKFEFKIEMTNGFPKVDYTPQSDNRKYQLYGKRDLTNDWEKIDFTNLGANRFFKVGVDLK